MSSDLKDKKSRGEVREMLVLIFQISISMIVPIAFTTYIGFLIGDKLLKSPGVPAVIGFFIGAASGMNGVYRLVKKYLKNK